MVRVALRVSWSRPGFVRVAKLTAPGTDYPEEFIEEFRIFHRELKDFFNASSVTDRLERQCREGNPPGSVTEGVNRFVRAKATVDAIPGSNQSDPQLLAAIEECLHALCDLRRTVDHEINHGQLAGEPPDQRQQWRLAEIGLEDLRSAHFPLQGPDLKSRLKVREQRLAQTTGGAGYQQGGSLDTSFPERCLSGLSVAGKTKL